MSSSFRDPCQRNSWKETVVGCAACRQRTRNQNSTKYPMLSPSTHWEYRKDSTQGNPKAQNPKSEPGSESWYLDSGKVDEKLETRILGYRVPGYGVPVLLENTRWYKDVLDVNLGLSCLSARGWYTKANCYGYVLIDWAEGQTGKYLAQAEVRTQRQMVWPNLTQSGNISILSCNQFCSTYICAFACRTVQQISKIRCQNVHFHFSWKKKKLQKLTFLPFILTRIYSRTRSRVAGISGPTALMRTALKRDCFFLWFSKEKESWTVQIWYKIRRHT